MADEQDGRIGQRGDHGPVTGIVPVSPVGAVRTPGALRGGVTMADDFDVWPDDIARALGMRD